MEMIEVKHAGAIIQLPHDVVVRNWMCSITESKHTASNNAIAIPKIGEYWRGQGGIYAGVMRGQEGKPDRHLIVPVADALDIKSTWGCRDKEIKGADNDLYGMPNTIAMAEAGSEIAKQILAMEIEGHSDFYLFARHEARLCYLTVPELFKTDDWYWTSTQSSANYAFLQHFLNGLQHSFNKNDECWVRPVRSFVI